MKNFLAAAALALLATAAGAQTPPGTGAEFPTVNGQIVPGVGNMCLNSAGKMVPWFAANGTWQCAGSAIPVSSTQSALDPCQSAAKTSVPISQTANAKLFSQTAAKKNYICSIMLVGADAENVSLVEGTGSTCGTSTAAIIGAATAAAGLNLAANGGFAMGSGVATVAAGANNNFDVCLFQSGSGRIGGVLTYVQQ